MQCFWLDWDSVCLWPLNRTTPTNGGCTTTTTTGREIAHNSVSNMWRLTLLITALLCAVTTFAGRQDLNQAVNSYVGQKLILRSYGDAQDVTVKSKDLNRPAGTCDKAVEFSKQHVIKTRSFFNWNRSELSKLEELRVVHVAGQKPRSKLPNWATFPLKLSVRSCRMSF